jgi:hypothetical protein
LAHQARALPPVPTAMTPKQFRAIAVEIWGDSWSAGAATALGVPIATVTGWMTAGRPIPPPIPSAMLAFQRAYEQMVTDPNGAQGSGVATARSQLGGKGRGARHGRAVVTALPRPGLIAAMGRCHRHGSANGVHAAPVLLVLGRASRHGVAVPLELSVRISGEGRAAAIEAQGSIAVEPALEPLDAVAARQGWAAAWAALTVLDDE